LFSNDTFVELRCNCRPKCGLISGVLLPPQFCVQPLVMILSELVEVAGWVQPNAEESHSSFCSRTTVLNCEGLKMSKFKCQNSLLKKKKKKKKSVQKYTFRIVESKRILKVADVNLRISSLVMCGLC